MELRNIYTSEKGLLTAFAESRTGGRAENQDSVGWQDTDFGYLVTVCDGMGGGPGGKTASDIAVREIIAGVAEAGKDEEVANIIIKAIRRANMAIIEAGNETPSLKGMGSTATVLLISEKSAFVAHVGDSRVYQLRGRRKIFRTFDHSMVFELVQQKVITEEQARLSAQSNIITRALGIAPDLKVDIQELAYERGDRFVLCSDGIHGTMPEEELVRMLTSRKTALGAVTDDIATYVDNLGRADGGGHDNLTIAIIETKTNSKLRPKMSRQTRLTLMALGIICLVSIAINIMQAVSGPKTSGDAAAKDSLIAAYQQKDTLQTDSIKTLNDSLLQLQKKIAKGKEALK